MAKKKSKPSAPPDPDAELKDTLASMHVELSKELLKRVRNGTATAADLNVARQFLKDNGIEGNLRKNAPLRSLAEELPFAADGTNG